MRIVRYEIVEEPTIRKMEMKVAEYIRDGWQPLGGVSVGTAYSGTSTDYIQAVVLYGDY